jgi:hypothetical protein
MDKFFQWCVEEKQELPVNPNHDPTENWEDVKMSDEEMQNEQRARTGWSANYPAAYFSAQYPALWMGPRKATHALDGEQMGRKK